MGAETYNAFPISLNAPHEALFDRVKRSAEWTTATFDGGKVRRIPGVGWGRRWLSAVTHRFELDELASATILDIAKDEGFWATTDLESVRLISGTFWLEWSIEGCGGSACGARQGIVVSGATGGQAGRILAYVDDGSGRPAAFSSAIAFDWVNDLRPKLQEFQLRHDEHRCLDGILSHAVVTPIGTWSKIFAAMPAHDRARNRKLLASYLWHFVPVLFVFLAYLEHSRAGGNPRDALGSAKTRTDAAEAPLSIPARPRPGIVYLGNLDLASFRRRVAQVARSAHRRKSKAHAVRGHFVTRGKTVFWRSSHVRGDQGETVGPKTIHVRVLPVAAE